MVKSILLAVDGSAYTEFVLKYGVALAKAFDAHLRVLTVVDVRFFEWAVAIGVEGFAPVLPIHHLSGRIPENSGRKSG